MAVESVRGLPATCFSCAILDASRRPEPTDTPVSIDDPRLLLGGFETTHALFRLASEHVMEFSRLTDFFGYYHRLRALVGMAFPGLWNAPQVLSGYDEWVEVLTMQGRFVDPTPLWQNLIAQGGYAPTPSTAIDEDQLFMVWTGTLALSSIITFEALLSLLRRLEAIESLWKGERATGSTVSFADFLRSAGAADWL